MSQPQDPNTRTSRQPDREIRIDVTAGDYRTSFILYCPQRASWRLCRMMVLEQTALELRDCLDEVLTGAGMTKLTAGRHRLP